VHRTAGEGKRGESSLKVAASTFLARMQEPIPLGSVAL